MRCGRAALAPRASTQKRRKLSSPSPKLATRGEQLTRVLLDSGDGHETWGAIGVSENVIEASWEALLDSLEHGVRRLSRSRATAAG